MLNIDKLVRSASSNTYGYRDHIRNKFNEYIIDCIGNVPYDDMRRKPFDDEYIRCLLSKEYLKDSVFYNYLLSKERTELIDKILNDNN